MKELRMFVRENTWGHGLVDHGWGNGYVILPVGHPSHGKGYDDIDVEVHGGLTFSESAEGLKWPEILPDDADGWVVGFDTAHYGDTFASWWKEAVVTETQRLMEQLSRQDKLINGQ